MPLAYNSNAYQNFSIEETIARIAALGFEGLELLADVPHAWPAGLLEEQKQSIRECLQRHRMAISTTRPTRLGRGPFRLRCRTVSASAATMARWSSESCGMRRMRETHQSGKACGGPR
jgi:hypothetical protein